MGARNVSTGLTKLKTFLGEPYEIRVMDGENVIYRNLENGFDIEVSGVDTNRSALSARIYVWRRNPGLEIVAVYEEIRSPQDLKDLLGAIAIEYRNTDPEKPLCVKSR